MAFLTTFLLLLSGGLQRPLLVGDVHDNPVFSQRQAEQERFLSSEMARLHKEFDLNSQPDPVPETPNPEPETTTGPTPPRVEAWGPWSSLALLVGGAFLLMEVWRQEPQEEGPSESSEEEEEEEEEGEDLEDGPPLGGCDFVVGFVDDLLGSFRGLCRPGLDPAPGGCVGVGSMFEKWGSRSEPRWDLLVPLEAPDGYAFKHEAVDSGSGGELRGRIAVYRGCTCNSLGGALCLVHRNTKALLLRGKPELSLESSLCSGIHLDVSKVLVWFGAKLRRAWGEVAHRYDFEVSFSGGGTPPCRIKLTHPSRRSLWISLTPAVRYPGSEVYPCATPLRAPLVDWLLSLAVYELHYLNAARLRLPRHSCHLECLRILAALRDRSSSSPPQEGAAVLTSYHFKTVLLHLLLLRPASLWVRGRLAEQLADVLLMLGRCLDRRRLHQFGVHPGEMGDPLRRAPPVNLFRPLLDDRGLYLRALVEYRELLSRAKALVPQGEKQRSELEQRQ
ncbi:inositol 1,4,5-trisphosphate receptor-interacting protein-like 1 [Acipenser ruthenus]|uniref:inositol 1,4,5-trisphosphate receptor-interacting protein-like 1 n=1 Tax=Acipenser ruthenus TaxID=7906 RepID=UPI0027423CF4|nr:inositol 1,4,5-trisphosphate receptor-interacting protein-like 1 [Acipenser ruthenus]